MSNFNGEVLKAVLMGVEYEKSKKMLPEIAQDAADDIMVAAIDEISGLLPEISRVPYNQVEEIKSALLKHYKLDEPFDLLRD